MDEQKEEIVSCPQCFGTGLNKDGETECPSCLGKGRLLKQIIISYIQLDDETIKRKAMFG